MRSRAAQEARPLSRFRRPEIRFRLRDSDLDWREVEGELVALDLRESRYLSVNQTGKELWGALAEGATREELVDRLADAFGIERSRAEADTDAFVSDLESRGVVVREGDD
jgi:Coenzyme PQQ synthesis protein D (PqqD)